MSDADEKLLPATTEDVAWTLRHALLFNKKRPFDSSRQLMTDVTAGHLIEALRQSGFVVMQRPVKVPRNDWPTEPKTEL